MRAMPANTPPPTRAPTKAYASVTYRTGVDRLGSLIDVRLQHQKAICGADQVEHAV